MTSYEEEVQTSNQNNSHFKFSVQSSMRLRGRRPKNNKKAVRAKDMELISKIQQCSKNDRLTEYSHKWIQVDEKHAENKELFSPFNFFHEETKFFMSLNKKEETGIKEYKVLRRRVRNRIDQRICVLKKEVTDSSSSEVSSPLTMTDGETETEPHVDTDVYLIFDNCV